MSAKLRILVVGCGTMGASHARAYARMHDVEIVGLVSRSPDTRDALSNELGGRPTFDEFGAALDATRPDAVSINTYTATHADYAIRALDAGAHVFVEKPIALSVEQAKQVVATAQRQARKLVVGYILRHHPSWIAFIEQARALGKPLVMRMSLNQQSAGAEWAAHKRLMETQSPIVDCGVHYVDVMCQMTGAKPIRVGAIGARLSDELVEGMYNYGHLHVTFDDGSCGWYEAGWGPMMSQEAFFVKDVVGPRGCVSMVAKTDVAVGGSSDINSHTVTNALRVHRSACTSSGEYAHADEVIDTADEPDHQALCDREQAYFIRAVREDRDLAQHMADAINSLRIVLAADEAYRTGQVVSLND
jgi:predicted dehydrogenase